MRKVRVFIFGVLALCGPAYAQEVIIPAADQWEFVAQPAPNPEPFVPGEAKYNSDTDDYTLTEPVARAFNVRAFMKSTFSFCAKNWLATMEVLIEGTGAGGEVRPGFFYGSEINDPQVITEIDTFRDGGPTFPYAWEASSNHLAVESQLGTFGEKSSGWGTSTFTFQDPAFSLSNSWLKVAIHNNRGDVSFSVDKESETIRLLAKAEYRENVPVYVAIDGSTRSSNSTPASTPQLQKVRNIRIYVLEPCDGLSVTEAISEVDPLNELEACPIASDAVERSSGGLVSLRSQNLLNSTVYTSALNHIENKLSYCNGVSNCPACPSTPTCPTPSPTVSPTSTPTPAPTVDPGDDEGDDDDGTFFIEEEVAAFISEVCPCNGFSTHGRYVSCVSKLLKNLLEYELIDVAMRGDLQSEAAQNNCSKPRRKRRSKS